MLRLYGAVCAGDAAFLIFENDLDAFAAVSDGGMRDEEPGAAQLVGVHLRQPDVLRRQERLACVHRADAQRKPWLSRPQSLMRFRRGVRAVSEPHTQISLRIRQALIICDPDLDARRSRGSARETTAADFFAGGSGVGQRAAAQVPLEAIARRKNVRLEVRGFAPWIQQLLNRRQRPDNRLEPALGSIP